MKTSYCYPSQAREQKSYTKITTDTLHVRLVKTIGTILLASKNEIWDYVKATLAGDRFCTDCRVSVLPFTPWSKLSMTTPANKLEWISCDIVPSPKISKIVPDSHYPYFLCTVDIATRFIWLYDMDDALSKIVIKALESFQADNGKFKRLCSDTGSAFLSAEL